MLVELGPKTSPKRVAALIKLNVDDWWNHRITDAQFKARNRHLWGYVQTRAPEFKDAVLAIVAPPCRGRITAFSTAKK